MIFMTLAGSYTFLAMGICAAGVSQCCQFVYGQTSIIASFSHVCQPSRSCETSSSSLSFTNNIFFSCGETYEAKTARAGSSAICAGTLVSISPRDAPHAILQLMYSVLTGSTQLQYRVRASLGEIDTNVPAQMADEPARAVLASYVSHN